jgi:hypothetical protein
MGGGGSAANVTGSSENRTRGLRDDLVIWLDSCFSVLSDDGELGQMLLEQVDMVSQPNFVGLKLCLSKTIMSVTFLGLL